MPSGEACHATILVVDDDESLRKALVRLLRRSGYEAQAANSAQEALAAVEASRIDLVLTDFRMPGATGADLVRELRARGSHVPAVLISVCFDAPENLEAVAEGLFQGSVAKPWDQCTLLARLAEAVGTQH